MLQSGGEGTYDGLRFTGNAYGGDSRDQSFLLRIEDEAEAELSHLWVEGNTSYVGIFGWDSEVSLANSVFTGNTATYLLTLSGDTGGEYEVHNNVFHDTTAPSSDYSVLLNILRTELQNNAVVGFTHTWVLYYELEDRGYNLFWDNDGGVQYDGTEEVEADPAFTDPAGGDFSLRAGYSPAIDAGNPDPSFDDTDGSRNDIGAFGGPSGAW